MFGGKPKRTTPTAAGSGMRISTGSRTPTSQGHSTRQASPGASRLASGSSFRSVSSSGSPAARFTPKSSSRDVAGSSLRRTASGRSHGSSTPSAATSRSATSLKTKFTMDDLTLSTTLGTGTFGRVRLAHHVAMKKFCALKILKKSEIIRLKQVDHIKSEVKILSMIQHPFIVNLLGHHQDEKRLYMLLEYVPGGELFSHLRREGRFSNDGSKFYAAEIALAFRYLHKYNIAYRDLKPENLLLTTSGHIKIADFGFAKITTDKTWTLCGTPEYLAPEIIQSKGHDKSVDWWALGILIYEMLAGFPPFYDEHPFGIYQKILSGRVEFPRHFDPKAKDLVRRLLTGDRTKRLGCLRGGGDDVLAHRWFSRVDWETLYRCEIPAPFKPDVRSESDTRNFDRYPDSDGDNARPLNARERALFEEFDSM